MTLYKKQNIVKNKLSMKLQVLFLLFLGGCSKQESKAVAEIIGLGENSIVGTAIFEETKEGVLFTVNIKSSKPEKLGVHIHAVGDCDSIDGSTAGGHWNPTNAEHGSWGGDFFHSGDIGNIIIDESGQGQLVLVDKYGRWTLGEEERTSLFNKAIIVHAGMDDKKSQPSGAAGKRIGCGVIKRIK